MKNLYIVGASGCGREVLNIIKDIHAIRGVQWNIVGFLDDDLQALDSIDCDYQVVGTIRRQMMFWRWGSPVHKSKKK